MKKKWFNQILSVMLTATLAAGMTACGNKEKGTVGTSTAPEVSTASTENRVKESETSVADEEVTYPLETDTKLSFWCGQQITLANEYTSWEQSPFHSGLYERTGVEIDYLYPAKGGDVGQSYNLLWADTELPDMVIYRIDVSKAQELLNDGAIWNLTEYLPIYAPNYWEWINRPENEAERKAITLADGSFWSVPAVREAEIQNVWQGHIIRQDWLDECGLNMPVTLEDWEKVLLTFKEKYGATYSFDKGVAQNTGGIASGTGSLNFISSTTLRVDDGKVVCPNVTTEYKDMVEVLKRWWDLGILDHDYLTADADTIRQKALAGEIGITCVASSQYTLIMQEAEEADNGANWVGLEYPRTEPGAPTSMILTAANKLTGYNTVITTGATEEEMITALKWIDYAWTEEGCMYWNFGEEGVSYNLDENGMAVITDLVTNDPQGNSNGRMKYTASHGGMPAVSLRSGSATELAKKGAAASEAWARNSEASSHYLPALVMEVEDGERVTELITPISTYITEESIKMLVGERPFSEFDQFVEHIYEMGLEEVLSIYQKYYDEYLTK